MKWKTLEEMILKLEDISGKLLIASMSDPVIKEAMYMIAEINIALSERMNDNK